MCFSCLITTILFFIPGKQKRKQVKVPIATFRGHQVSKKMVIIKYALINIQGVIMQSTCFSLKQKRHWVTLCFLLLESMSLVPLHVFTQLIFERLLMPGYPYSMSHLEFYRVKEVVKKRIGISRIRGKNYQNMLFCIT